MNVVFTFIFRALSITVLWFLVPAIMAGFIFMGMRIAYRVAGEDNKVSAKAGVRAGFAVFIIFFIYKISSFRVLEFSQNIMVRPNFLYIALGVLIGLILLWVLSSLVYTRVIGFITLLLVSSGAIFLYSYFFIRTFNDFLISSSLGIILGVWLFIIIKPESFKDIFGTTEQHKHGQTEL